MSVRMLKQNLRDNCWRSLLTIVLILSLPLQVYALPGEQKWLAPTFGNIGSSAAINPVYDHIYVGSANHYVYAYDSFGALMWRFKTGGYIGATATVSTDGSRVYIGSYDGNLYALDAATGNELWRYATGGAIYSSPAYADSATLYVGSSDGTLYAINATTGVEQWQYTIGANVGASPAIGMDGTVYVGAQNGYIYALSSESSPISRLKWSQSLSTGGVMSAAIESGNRLYVGTFDNTFIAMDVATSSTNRVLWSTNLGGRIGSSPAIGAAGTIFVSSFDDGALNALDPDNGAVKWKMFTGSQVYSSPAVADDGTVFIGSFDNTFYAITPQGNNYSTKWRFNTDSEVISSPAIANDGTVYVVSKSSNLYAIEDNNGGLVNSTWPMFGRDSRRSQMTKDSDGDSLDDKVEIAMGLDPFKSDTDTDGYNDFIDVMPLDTTRAFYIAPTISAVSAAPSIILGGKTTQLQSRVSYPALGAGALSYSWAAPGLAGSFNSVVAASPIFTTFNTTGDHTYHISVTVSDGVYSSTRSTQIIVEGDTDGDGMSDTFENLYGFDMNDATDATLNPDVDNDNLSNVLEYEHRTDPRNPDTDSDNMSDGDEVAVARNPLINEPVLIVIINSLLLN